jgi:hypothetical protein
MVDKIAPGGILFDIKTTGVSAHPDVFTRTMERDHATQACWYQSGARALHETGKLDDAPTAFRFVAIETFEPFCVAVYEVGASLLEAATSDVHKATATWARCLLTNDWPGYSKDVTHVEASVGKLIKSEEAKLSWSMAA